MTDGQTLLDVIGRTYAHAHKSTDYRLTLRFLKLYK